MKMVKSLVLASAAGLVAVSGAQAADLPVKAKPVEYVKICSLYGAGFYYIPGTDICLKLGGYVRQEWGYGFGASLTTGPWSSTSGLNTRVDGAADTVWRTRAYMTMDTRQQTAYGTLRTYFNFGVSGNNDVALTANRAFIQIAGFTVGRATSYFDHYSSAAVAYLVDWTSDTGDGGQEVFAYTAQLGNGLSGSISLENPNARRTAILSDYDTLFFGTTTNRYAKLIVPDVVGNLRIDQAWGSAQVMAAVHDASGAYYVANNQNNGHPSDTWGYAVGAGLKVNFPMIGPGDYFAAQVTYANGAVRYAANNASWGAGVNADYDGGTSMGYGVFVDGVYGGSVALGTATDIQKTTAWSVAAAYEHFWTPSLRTSVHGAYLDVSYNAVANTIICNNIDATAGVTFITGACTNDFSAWQIGSRTQWNITKDFYVGLDVVYQKLDTASDGNTVLLPATGAQPAGIRTIEDQDNLATRLRWHRDIVP